MARPDMPTIPKSKLSFFREQLYRELAHMFVWEGLPENIPRDYLERNLVRHGHVLYYEDDLIGQDILRASPQGFNRHDLPTTARAIIYTSTNEISKQVERNIRRLSDSESVIEEFDRKKDGVLITNMEYGQNAKEIVDHFAYRLALTQQAFDTNLLWQNRPIIFPTDGNEMKLSLEKLFDDIFTGKPFSITDKRLFMNAQAGQDVAVKLEVPYIGKELMDTRNEIMMHFRETVGITTAGVDKAERVNTLEVESNVQHTKTVLQIMLEQREIAAENINAFFDQNIKVTVLGEDEIEDQPEGGEFDNGNSDGGTQEFAED